MGRESWTALRTKRNGTVRSKANSFTAATAFDGCLDGLMSLDAGPDGCTVETVPVEPAVDRPEVNVDASKGRLRVDVVSATGSVLTCFDLDSSEPIRGNHVRHAVKWSRRPPICTRQPIRLRLHFDNGRLYGYGLHTGNALTNAHSESQRTVRHVPSLHVPVSW